MSDYLDDLPGGSNYQDPALIRIHAENNQRDELTTAQANVRKRIAELKITKIEFPLDCLPAKIAAFVRAYMDVFKVPGDHYGLAILTAAGAAIGNAARIDDRGTHHPAVLNSVFVDVPGSGKTPTIATVLRPFVKIEAENQMRYAEALADYKAEAKLKKTKEDDSEDEPPSPAETLVGDFTLESLVDVLENNSRGILAWADEIEGFLAGMDKYRTGKGGDEKFWLSAYTGEPYKINRRGRGKPLYLPRVFCPFMGGVQPGLLKGFGDDNRDSSGFLSRLLFTIPPLAKKQKFHNQRPHDKHAQHWDQVIRLIFSVPPSETIVNAGGLELVKPHVMKISPAAYKLYADFYNGLGDRINDLDPTDLTTRSTLVKFETHCLRFALILHFLDWASNGGPPPKTENEFADALADGYRTPWQAATSEISADCMLRAVTISEYFMATGLEVVGRLESPVKALDAEYQIWYEELPTEFSTAKALLLAKDAGFSESTVKRMLKPKAKLFKRVRNGVYEKLW